MTEDTRAALAALERMETFGQDCSRCLRVTCLEHMDRRHADEATIREALAAPDVRVAELTIVGTCDWGDCDGETVGIRLDRDARWLSVCAEHSEICRAMDAIWRLTCLPFSDADRHVIQGIALAWINGHGPRTGSDVERWTQAALAPGEPKSCTCSNRSVADYEGPLRECPIPGEPKEGE